LLSIFNREEDRLRRACLGRGGVLELGAISILLLIILMTSMQTLTQIPNYASARITPTPVVGSIQSEGASILPTSIRPTLGGQPIVPASSDTINGAAQNMTDPLQNTSLSSITQQASIDSALPGQPPAVPVPGVAINDETINNDHTDGSDDGNGNGGGNGNGNDGDGNGDNHDDNGDHNGDGNGDNHDDNGDHNGDGNGDNHDDNGDHNGDNHNSNGNSNGNGG
jgi:hypothetical protein